MSAAPDAPAGAPAAPRCWACGAATEPAAEAWLAGLRRCPSCGLAFGAAREEEVRELYRGEEYFDGYAGGALEEGEQPLREQEARVRVRLLRRAVPAGRVLEVGAGSGHFLAAARRAGYKVIGIEPTDNGAEAARRRFGLEIVQGFVEAVELEAAGFDAACAWHVLEHVPEPRAALERVRGWLRPGGALLVEVPNLASRAARRYGAGWRHLDARHHVAHYTPAALGALLERAGFAVEDVHTVAYATYRPATSPLAWASVARELTISGGAPWRPHPSRYELLRAVARVP